MSFLNPVNEPVLRFKSTDAGAPQIDYNARVAGDVKAVLKACLVTGYGAKASAGWSAVNEVANVIEFVSPSVAMSDYRLGIDDTSASSTTWYYQYQDVRVDMNGSSVSKSGQYIDTSNAANAWELLVTARGLIMIDYQYNTTVSATLMRITYWGQVKSAIPAITGDNISWFCVGHHAPTEAPHQFFSDSYISARHYNVEGVGSFTIETPIKSVIATYSELNNPSELNLVSSLFLSKNNFVLAEHPGFLLTTRGDNTPIQSAYAGVFNGRPVIYGVLGRAASIPDFIKNSCHTIALLHLDFWEY